jgi:hypothetical protein
VKNTMTRNNFHTSTNINTGGPHDNFISAEDSMFEASVDDENTGQSAFGTEFYNEPLDNHDWDTDRSFVPQVISPSSLSSFHNASEGNKKIRLERSILIMILVQESSLIKHHFRISLRVLR